MTQPPVPVDPSHLENVRTGQKLMIYALLLNLAVIPLSVLLGNNAGLLSSLVWLVAVVLAIMGLVRVARGLAFGILATIVFCILLFIPLINLLVLVILNAKATALLRQAGYKVGLWGAEKRPA
jgi:hypothetical protein